MRKLPIVTRCVLAASAAVFATAVSRATPAYSDWPVSIDSDTGFADLGNAIKREPGFPAHGSDVEKARYIHSRMGDVARKYGLKAGSGGLVSNVVIGLSRVGLNPDPENADGLKGSFGWGNCGEWSYAFSEILGGADVACRVIFADSARGTGHSAGFGGTDTTVIVEERSRDGKISRRVFDPFRAAFHSATYVPTDGTLKDWGDRPLTDADKWQGESGDSWQTMIGSKPFIKDATNESELPAVASRSLPSTTARPAPAGTSGNAPRPGGGSADPNKAAREAALQQAREAMARAYVLAGYLESSQSRIAADYLAAAKGPFQKAKAAMAALDGVSSKSPAIQTSRTELRRQIDAFKSKTAALEKAYMPVFDVERPAAERARVICGYAQRCAATPADQVRVWKKEANSLVNQTAKAFQNAQQGIEAVKTSLQQQRDDISRGTTQFTTLYQSVRAQLPSLRALEDSQAEIRTVLRRADALRVEMGKAFQESRTIRQTVNGLLQPHAGNEEVDRVMGQVNRLVGNLRDPEAVVGSLRTRFEGHGGLSAVAARSLDSYRALVQTIDTLNAGREAADAENAFQEAETVQLVGEKRVRKVYESLHKALQCYAGIKGGVPPKPPVVNLRSVNLTGTWICPGATLTIRGNANSTITATYVRPRDNCRHEETFTLRKVNEQGPLYFEGTFVDVDKFCCGNQGVLQYWLTDSNTLHGRVAWWSKGKPQPAKLGWTDWVTAHRK